jgi:hypothetical protein
MLGEKVGNPKKNCEDCIRAEKKKYCTTKLSQIQTKRTILKLKKKERKKERGFFLVFFMFFFLIF